MKDSIVMTHINIYYDAFELLALIKLKPLDIKVSHISNADPLVYRLFETLDLLKYFDNNVYLSYDISLCKPDPMFFDYVITDILKNSSSL